MRRILILCVAFAACSGLPVPSDIPTRDAFVPAPRLIAATATANAVYFVRETGTRCELDVVDRASSNVSTVQQLEFCPNQMSLASTDSLLLSSPSKSLWLTFSGNALYPAERVVAVRDHEHFLAVREGHLVVHSGESSTDLGPAVGLSHPRLLADGSVIALEQLPEGETLTHISTDGRRPILPAPMVTIDSFDVSPAGGEIVLSAKRESFDVALVPVDGGAPKWIGTDAADETTVTWAPRGNKVSWVIRTFGGDVIRTVHIPTSFSLLADAEGGAIRALSWEPQAEKFVYIVSAPSSSDAIKEMKYGGDERTALVPSAAVVDLALEPWPEAGASSFLARPRNSRYGEKYPAVVWVGGNVHEWSDARAVVAGAGNVGIIVTDSIDGPFWDALAQLPWIDRSAVTVVSVSAINRAGIPKAFDVSTIEPDRTLNETVFRDASGTIRERVAGVGADVVESVAARITIRQRKGPAAADAKH